VQISQHKGQVSAYSQNKVKQLTAANKAEHHLATASANKKETAVKIQTGAAIAAGFSAHILGRMVAHSPSSVRGKLYLASLIASGATLALAGSAVATQGSANKNENQFHNANQ
jgi:hypothetical protein